MKTKRKRFMALLATFAIGSVAVAGFGMMGMKSGVAAHAETAAVEVEEEQTALDFGVHTLNLKAGEAQTYSFASNLVGIYGFEWLAGEATITFNDVEGAVTLNESNKDFSLSIASPTTTTVTFSSSVDVDFEFTLTYSYTYTDLVIGSNTVNLTANNVQNCIIGSGVEGEQAPSGWYTFTRLGFGIASFDFIIDGIPETKSFTMMNGEFTVQIVSPSTTVIPVYSTMNSTINFAITYSETDPNAPDVATLNVGENTVNATGEGAEYVFTSENGGSYSLSCHDQNAYIMVETVYVDPDFGDVVNYEEVPLFDAEYNQYGEVVEIKEWLTYEFTVEAGKSVKFLMSTLDWSDAQYTVTITENK